MNKFIVTCLAVAAGCLSTLADVNINFQSAVTQPVTVKQQYLMPDSVAGYGKTERQIAIGSDNTASYKVVGNRPVRLQIESAQFKPIALYVTPDENITVDISAAGHPNFKGSELMEKIGEFQSGADSYLSRLAALRKSGGSSEEYDSVYSRLNDYVCQYVRHNADSPVAAYALLQTGGNDFMTLYEILGSKAKSSILYPLVEENKKVVERRLQLEAYRHKLESGTTPAPAFSLSDVNGKRVSLADFKGKWVVLDFWGAWCRWCIKGFPELKKAYKDYAGKLEVIGIDCQDSPEQWLDAVKKYELPWVNVYNDMKAPSPTVDQLYGVSGFPTKVIVSPEGIIKKIVVGEDPEFYTFLREFIDK